MIRRIAVAVWLISFLVTMICAGDAYSKEPKGDPATSFRKDYPAVTFESIEPTNIDGLYEVIAGNKILYYHPGTGNVFFGEIITKSFVNITAKKRNKLVSARLKELPLNKAIRLGKGKHVVIEFTDIDCPFCRKLEEYFEKRDDITRYVFLLPLESIHPNALNKSLSILCSVNRGTAYKDAMKGLLDSKDILPCTDGSVIKLLEEYKESAVKLGVQGTPALWVNNTPVMGADIPQIDQILSESK
jgi:thiol:disulfide interchange protein DsbC